MKIFYSLGVFFYVFGIHIASTWNAKAKKWVAGRKNVWDELKEFDSSGEVIWFHCASLGEFEQGRPIMEKLKEKRKLKIVVTFFSPSGFEIRKDYNGADLVCYLPRDSKKNAKRFLDRVSPDKIYFVKYEFWANYITEAKKRNIEIFSVSAVFRKSQIFFKFYGGYMRSILKKFDAIFVQNKASQNLLASIAVDSIHAGDTRYDRVYENSLKVQQYDLIEAFIAEKKVLVCGSIWLDDLKVIKHKINDLSDWKIIIAPHEIKDHFIHEIIEQLNKKCIQYSVLNESNNDADVLIIDNIGMLMNVYQYGDIAYVGGGFKTGLHNILEPASFGLPVIFGNKYQKFPEAFEFIENEIGFSVEDDFVFNRVFNELSVASIKENVVSFINSKRGATSIILEYSDSGKS